MVDLVGHTLGQYRILEQLGRGGMAEVFKAYQPGLDRYVAVKVLHPMVAADEQFLARFQREAKAVAALRHPHIVHIHDFGYETDRYYMVMEYVEGQTLKHRLDSLRQAAKFMPLDEVVRTIAEVASALDYAHQRGMIHRDVKPANILLTTESDAVLSDFGIAYMVEGTRYTLTGVIGTPDYMSPEQGMGRPVDARSDIYSLGVVLYEMLTGKVPFSADTPMATIFKHVQNPLPLPRTVNPTISESVERVVLKAMAKDPNDRFRTTGEMAEALQAAITSGVPAFEISLPDLKAGDTALPGLQPALIAAGLSPPDTARVVARPTFSGSLIAGGLVALVGVGLVALLAVAGILWLLLRDRGTGQEALVGSPTSSAIPTVANLPSATPDSTPTSGSGATPPVPRPDGSLIFEDNFSDSSEGAQPLFADERMTFEYADGKGRLASSYAGAIMPVMYSALELADFYAEFEFQAPVAQSDSGYGFIFRSEDARDGRLDRYAMLSITPGRAAASLARWQHPDWAAYKEFTLPPGVLNPSGLNRVRLEAVGNELRVFVNGTFSFASNDIGLLEAGIFGFFIVPSQELEEGKEDFVYFDALRVYSAGESISTAGGTLPPAHALEENTATPAPTPTATSSPVPPPPPTPMLSLTQRETGLLNQVRYRPQNGSVVFAYRADPPPDVDGRLDDWPGYAFPVTHAVFQPENLDGPTDLSAAGLVRWDDGYFYVGIQVTDDILVQTQSGAEIYKGDSAEIQFDHDLAGDFDAQSLDEDDHQIGLSPGDFAGRGPEAYVWLPKSQEQPGTIIELAASRTGDGYVLEAAIPWWVMGGRPPLETPLGFCLSVSDNDTPAAAEQRVMISLCPNRKWSDPTTFGTLILVDWR